MAPIHQDLHSLLHPDSYRGAKYRGLPAVSVKSGQETVAPAMRAVPCALWLLMAC